MTRKFFCAYCIKHKDESVMDLNRKKPRCNSCTEKAKTNAAKTAAYLGEKKRHGNDTDLVGN